MCLLAGLAVERHRVRKSMNVTKNLSVCLQCPALCRWSPCRIRPMKRRSSCSGKLPMKPMESSHCMRWVKVLGLALCCVSVYKRIYFLHSSVGGKLHYVQFCSAWNFPTSAYKTSVRLKLCVFEVDLISQIYLFTSVSLPAVFHFIATAVETPASVCLSAAKNHLDLCQPLLAGEWYGAAEQGKRDGGGKE